MSKKEKLKEDEPDKEEFDKAEDKPEEKCSKKELDMDDDSEDDSEEEKKKKKKTKKGEGGGQNPVESSDASQQSDASVTPGFNTPSKAQNVFVPQSSVQGKREQETPMGKAAEVDLTKSPLWQGLNKQMDAMQDALGKKVDALQKSVDDRMSNIKKDMEKIEKFYNQSFYKAASEEAGAEGLRVESFAKQMERGELRFRSK